jgi:hypothetical protein
MEQTAKGQAQAVPNKSLTFQMCQKYVPRDKRKWRVWDKFSAFLPARDSSQLFQHAVELAQVLKRRESCTCSELASGGPAKEFLRRRTK